MSPIRRIPCLLFDFLRLGRIVRIVKMPHEVRRRRILDAPFVQQVQPLRDCDVEQPLNLLGENIGNKETADSRSFSMENSISRFRSLCMVNMAILPNQGETY